MAFLNGKKMQMDDAISPFVGWNCTGVMGYSKCREVCAWCRDEAHKADRSLEAAGFVAAPKAALQAGLLVLCTARKGVGTSQWDDNMLKDFDTAINGLRTVLGTDPTLTIPTGENT